MIASEEAPNKPVAQTTYRTLGELVQKKALSDNATATRRHARVLALSAVLIASACARTESAPEAVKVPAPDPQLVRSSIDSVNKLYRDAIFAKNANQIVGFYDSEAVIISTGAPPVRGSKEILAMASTETGMRVTGLDYTPNTFVVDGDLAVETATYRLTMQGAEATPPRVETGGSMVVWRRQPDNSWKIFREMQSGNPDGATHSHR